MGLIMSWHYCSLAVSTNQSIPSKKWTTVRFPYDTESTDVWDMHRAQQPTGGPASRFPDARSALIWPHVSGLGIVEAYFELEPGAYTEVRSMFVRDPLGVSNTTADEHHAPTPGGQYYNRLHMLMVSSAVPLAFMVYHNAPDPVETMYAQFKLAVDPDVADPVETP